MNPLLVYPGPWLSEQPLCEVSKHLSIDRKILQMFQLGWLKKTLASQYPFKIMGLTPYFPGLVVPF